MSVADLLLSTGTIKPDPLLYEEARKNVWVQNCFSTVKVSKKWEWNSVVDLFHIAHFSSRENQSMAHKLLEEWGNQHSNE